MKWRSLIAAFALLAVLRVYAMPDGSSILYLDNGNILITHGPAATGTVTAFDATPWECLPWDWTYCYGAQTLTVDGVTMQAEKY